jgi:hypothetical protein
MMDTKSLMAINTNVLIDYKQASTLNPDNWDISEYINWKYDMNAALAFSKLFFPDFIEKDGCIILSFRYNEETFETWKQHFNNDITAIETACNMYQISDYFSNNDVYESDEHFYEAIKAFSHALKTAWQLNCKVLFPQRNIIVDVYGDREETKITLFTVQ